MVLDPFAMCHTSMLKKREYRAGNKPEQDILVRNARISLRKFTTDSLTVAAQKAWLRRARTSR